MRERNGIARPSMDVALEVYVWFLRCSFEYRDAYLLTRQLLFVYRIVLQKK